MLAKLELNRNMTLWTHNIHQNK